MLVLSRKPEESIVIGHKIRIAVIDVKGQRVRLGIEAPADVPVHRLEVERAIEREAAGEESAEMGAAETEPSAAGSEPSAGSALTATEIEIANQTPLARRRPKHNRIIGDLRQERDELLAERDGLLNEVDRLKAELLAAKG